MQPVTTAMQLAANHDRLPEANFQWIGGKSAQFELPQKPMKLDKTN